MRLTAGAAVAVLLITLASARAGAGGARPPVALTASPARVELAGAGRAVVRITNSGLERVAVDVSRAGFALDLRGRPKIVGPGGTRRSAARWLGVRPRRLVLRAGATRSVTVTARPPSRAEPGDHDALVLFTTRRKATRRIAVRMRMGVVVVVRVPGRVRHRLEVRALRVVARGRVRTLELVVANRGNVTESFARRRAVLFLHRAGRRIKRLTAPARTLRPGTLGVLEFRYRGAVSGPVIARVDVASDSGRVVRRTVRIRL